MQSEIFKTFLSYQNELINTGFCLRVNVPSITVTLIFSNIEKSLIATEHKTKRTWTKGRFFNIRHMRQDFSISLLPPSSLSFRIKSLFGQHSKNLFSKFKTDKNSRNPPKDGPDLCLDMLVFFTNLSGQAFNLIPLFLSNRQLHVVLDRKTSQESAINVRYHTFSAYKNFSIN